MEKSVVSGKKTSGKYVYVLIRYNNDDNHDAYVVGVYKSLSKAKDVLLECIHEDFELWVDCGGESFETTSSSGDFERKIDSSECDDNESKSKSDDHSQKTATAIIKDLHEKYLHALSAPKQRENKHEPGFDKRNWEHVKPLIIKEIDTYKTRYCEYINNPYSYKDYKISKQTVIK